MPAPRVDRRALARTLHSAAIRLLRRLRAVDVHEDLGPARASALSVLVFGGPKTPSELADAEQVARPTITRLVQGMERDGLVRVVPDENDGRAVRIHPTARGRTLLERGRERRVDELAKLLEGLNEADVRCLGSSADLLARLSGSPERTDPASEAKPGIKRRGRS